MGVFRVEKKPKVYKIKYPGAIICIAMSLCKTYCYYYLYFMQNKENENMWVIGD